MTSDSSTSPENTLRIGYGNLTTSRYSCGLCAGPVEWGGVEIELPETPANPLHWTCGVVVCQSCAVERDPELAAIADELRTFEASLMDSGLFDRQGTDDGSVVWPYRYLTHHLLMVALCDRAEDMRLVVDRAAPRDCNKLGPCAIYDVEPCDCRH